MIFDRLLSVLFKYPPEALLISFLRVLLSRLSLVFLISLKVFTRLLSVFLTLFVLNLFILFAFFVLYSTFSLYLLR